MIVNQVTANDGLAVNFSRLKYSDSNPPLYCIQSQSRCYRKTYKMTIRGILWHETAGGNPYIRRYVQPDDDAVDKDYWLNVLGKNKYSNDWNHKEVDKGLNCWIGKLADGTVTTVQTMPWNYKPWGCGKGVNGSCNDGWIQFEICDDQYKDEEYFRAAYEEACQLTAYLCAKFNIDPLGTVEYKGKKVPTILDHRESHKLGFGGNHGDVKTWFSKYGKYDNGMETVRKDVAELLSGARSYIPVVKTGDIVTVTSGAVSRDRQLAQSYVTSKKWTVSQSEDESEYATLGQCADSSSLILNKEYLKTDLSVQRATGSVDKPTNTGTVTGEERIWNILYDKIRNAYGVAGVMGNMMAESGLNPTNLQNTYEKSLGFTDTTYTVAVDNGTYTNFVKDSAGYGLVQWTYWTLKRDLLAYAQANNKSIGDLDMQCNYLCDQLKNSYKSVWKTLTEATSVRQASDSMLHDFERPADQSESVELKRASFGQNFYDRHAGSCVHTRTSKQWASAATCTEDGYTGDLVCINCNQTVSYGEIIPCTGHVYHQGVCSVCGAVEEGGSTGETDEDLVTREDLMKILELLQLMLDREYEGEL